MHNKFGFVYLTTCKVNNKKYIGRKISISVWRWK